MFKLGNSTTYNLIDTLHIYDKLYGRIKIDFQKSIPQTNFQLLCVDRDQRYDSTH